MDIRTKLDNLAKSIAAKADDDDTPFVDRVDAFKALHAYYVTLLKHKEGDDDGDTGFNFNNGIHTEETDGGTTGVRRRRSS